MANDFTIDLRNSGEKQDLLADKETSSIRLLDIVDEADIVERNVSIPIDNCTHYKNHIFSIGNLEPLAEDIKHNGLLHPIIGRWKSKSSFEVISGHRRLEASKLAGLTEIAAIVVDLGDEKADQIMVNANLLQRQNITDGEMARAIRIRYKDVFHQGKKKGEQTYKLIARDLGKSESFAKRMTYLARISDELLSMMEKGLIRKTVAESLRHLSAPQMDEIAQLIKKDDHKLTQENVKDLIKGIKKGKSLRETWDELSSVYPDKSINVGRISIDVEHLKAFIPENSTVEEVSRKAYELLEEYYKSLRV